MGRFWMQIGTQESMLSYFMLYWKVGKTSYSNYVVTVVEENAGH